MAGVVERFNWLCHAYCLMTNHYHLMTEATDGNLSAGMCQLNGVYTQRFNRRHARVGHIFQGRFKAIIVDRDSSWWNCAVMSYSTRYAPGWSRSGRRIVCPRFGQP